MASNWDEGRREPDEEDVGQAIIGLPRSNVSTVLRHSLGTLMESEGSYVHNLTREVRLSQKFVVAGCLLRFSFSYGEEATVSGWIGCSVSR